MRELTHEKPDTRQDQDNVDNESLQCRRQKTSPVHRSRLRPLEAGEGGGGVSWSAANRGGGLEMEELTTVKSGRSTATAKQQDSPTSCLTGLPHVTWERESP